MCDSSSRGGHDLESVATIPLQHGLNLPCNRPHEKGPHPQGKREFEVHKKAQTLVQGLRETCTCSKRWFPDRVISPAQMILPKDGCEERMSEKALPLEVL